MSKQQICKFDGNDKRNEKSSKPLQGNQKSKAIAISVASCLFMSIVGYEVVVRESHSGLIAGQIDIEHNSDHVKSKSNNGFEFAKLGNLLEDDEDDYQIRQLKDTNAKQSAKIRALRQELLEKVQNVYSIKADLFKQEGDPRDKEKLTELTQLLQEKDQQIQLYKNNIDKLERRIAGFGIERNALLEQKDGVQKLKEEEIVALKQHMDVTHVTLQSERAELEKKLRTLEATQYHLVESLEKKAEAIIALENELQIQKDVKQKLEESRLIIASKTEALEQEEAKRRLLETQIAQHKTLEDNLEEKQGHLLALEQALLSLTVDSDYMEKTLEASQNTINSQAESLAALQEESKKLQHEFEDELEKKGVLANALLERQAQTFALEETLANLILNTELLELQLANAHELAEKKTQALAQTEQNVVELQEGLEEEVQNRTILVETLVAHQQQVLELQNALANISLEKKELKVALEEAEKLIANKTDGFASAQENAKNLSTQLHEEKMQRVLIGEVVREREAHALALENALAILTSDVDNLKHALEATQDIVVSKSESLILAEQDVKMLQLKLDGETKVQAEFAEALAHKQSQTLDLEAALSAKAQETAQLNQALIASQAAVEERNHALELAQKDAQKLQKRIDGEFQQRSMLAKALEEKQEHATVLENTIYQLAKDSEELKKALKESQELLAVKVGDYNQLMAEAQSTHNALNEAQKVIDTKTKELELALREVQTQQEQQTLLAKAHEETQQHAAALENANRQLSFDSENLKGALAKSQELATNKVNAFAQLEKEANIVKGDLQIAKANIEGKAHQLELALGELKALTLSLEEETKKSLLFSNSYNEKNQQFQGLEKEYITLSFEKEQLESHLKEAREVLTINALALDEARNLREQYDEELLYRNVLADALVEKREEIQSLDQAFSSVLLEAEKLKEDLANALEHSANQAIALQAEQSETQSLQKLLQSKIDEHEILAQEAGALKADLANALELSANQAVALQAEQNEMQSLQKLLQTKADENVILAHEAEKLKADLANSLELSTNQAIALHAEQNEKMSLQKLLSVKTSEHEILTENLKENQLHVRALEHTLSALTADSERLLVALNGSQDLIAAKSIALESAEQDIRRLLHGETEIRSEFEKRLAAMNRELEASRNAYSHLEQELNSLAAEKSRPNALEGGVNEFTSSNSPETTLLQDGKWRL